MRNILRGVLLVVSVSWVLGVLPMDSAMSRSQALSGVAFAEEGGEGKTTKRKRRKRVNVDKLRKQYWRQEDEYDVVQNRIYTKANKLEFHLFGGIVDSDPFLTTRNAGLSLGYHFTEFFSAHLLYWNAFSNPSDALKVLEKEQNATANTNPPEGFIGAELGASLIYGKLSLLGKAILYYDLHLLGGGGQTLTETGNYITFHGGVGQQVYMSKRIALRLDYRFMYYRETIVEKNKPATKGQAIGDRTNLTNAITLGLTFLVL